MSTFGLRKAVQSVRKYITEYNDILGRNIDSLTIEETELSEDGKFWLITVSFDRELDLQKSKTYVTNPLFSEITDRLPREKTFVVEKDYKIFKINAQNGEVVSMKMYRL